MGSLCGKQEIVKLDTQALSPSAMSKLSFEEKLELELEQSLGMYEMTFDSFMNIVERISSNGEDITEDNIYILFEELGLNYLYFKIRPTTLIYSYFRNPYIFNSDD